MKVFFTKSVTRPIHNKNNANCQYLIEFQNRENGNSNQCDYTKKSDICLSKAIKCHEKIDDTTYGK